MIGSIKTKNHQENPPILNLPITSSKQQTKICNVNHINPCNLCCGRCSYIIRGILGILLYLTLVSDTVFSDETHREPLHEVQSMPMSQRNTSTDGQLN
jgi:hypothetical protein